MTLGAYLLKEPYDVHYDVHAWGNILKYCHRSTVFRLSLEPEVTGRLHHQLVKYTPAHDINSSWHSWWLNSTHRKDASHETHVHHSRRGSGGLHGGLQHEGLRRGDPQKNGSSGKLHGDLGAAETGRDVLVRRKALVQHRCWWLDIYLETMHELKGINKNHGTNRCTTIIKPLITIETREPEGLRRSKHTQTVVHRFCHKHKLIDRVCSNSFWRSLVRLPRCDAKCEQQKNGLSLHTFTLYKILKRLKRCHTCFLSGLNVTRVGREVQ